MFDPELLDKIITETVARNAVEVDRTATFPRENIDALAEAGFLGVTVPVEFGGLGLGLCAAADIVRRISRGCGSTAMVVLMHYAATAVLDATGRTRSCGRSARDAT